jgi:hypothetical protein
MMDDPKYGPTASWPEQPGSEPLSHEADATETPSPAGDVDTSPAAERFRSCRWRATPDAGDFCTHRDVLPFAGKEGFKPESWCPECAFYKLRRTPKKRERSDYMY